MDGLVSNVLLGRYRDGSPCSYDIGRAANFSSCLVGMSGAGKSHNLRKMARGFVDAGLTVIMIDGQGDLEMDGAVDVTFRYQSSEASVNPMRIDPDPEGGGVLLAIRQTLQVVKMFGQLGDLQEADLHHLMLEAYADAGILPDDPSTWSRPVPGIPELADRVHRLANRLRTGIEADFFEPLGEIRTKILQMKQEGNTDEVSKQQQSLIATIEKLVLEGLDKELSKRSWDRKRIAGLEHKLNRIVATGLFSGDDLSIKARRINRIDLTKLHLIDQRVMYYLLLERIFDVARRTCQSLNSGVPRFILIVDEAKYAAARMDDPLSPLNRIASEGRKFGLGIVVGVQSLSHLTEDVLHNFAMQLVLKLSPQATDRAARLFKVNETVLQNMEAKQDALYSLNGSRFQSVRL